MPRSRKPLLERLLDLCIPEPNSGCWLWLGVESYGYGQVHRGGPVRDMVLAHRASYELHVGPIPDGLYVCHKCDVTQCVNPDHLFLGTHADNMNDMRAKGREARGYRHGTRTKPERQARGEGHGNSTLTESIVRAIRLGLEQGERGCDLAKRFGVARSCITKIKQRKHWSHVT